MINHGDIIERSAVRRHLKLLSLLGGAGVVDSEEHEMASCRVVIVIPTGEGETSGEKLTA